MKLSHLSHAKSPRGATAQEEAPPKTSQRGASSSGNAPHALAGGSPRHPSSGGGIRPRSDILPPSLHSASDSSVLGTMRGFMGWGSSSKVPEPDPRAWLDSNMSEAKAARRRLLDGATPLLKQVDNASPLSSEPHRLHTYITFDDAQNTVLVPAKELLPGLLRSDQFIELSPDQLSRANALSTTHPGVKTQMPDMKHQLRSISPETAAHLAAAREAIDLVKALMPDGTGNQIKDIAATAGDSVLRSSLSHSNTGNPTTLATKAIQFQGGNCDAHAGLAYQLLSQNPALKNARIEIVDGGENGNHTFVVIRGKKREHDIVVDPWATFASPTLVQDALPMHRKLLSASGGGVAHTKPAGTQAAPLDIEALRQQALIDNRSPIAEQFKAQRLRAPDDVIRDSVKYADDRWDVPFSGNPNVRYEVRDASGHQLTDFPLRFDMQRVATGTGPRQA
ncbi:hypothetical protein [Acidovorax sp. SUPP2825]|uniref:hypothetical protein n=1 Tax=Acidovorax sp. SUPP2825 TaxID=2920879 RepID=UPI0023DE3755|nr:hypothetical protein [Acidovorax sp. SUPP2825]GKS96088.1 hypothetical protein AVAK2825_16155 [Acidovorax sp. SUPP2825]